MENWTHLPKVTYCPARRGIFGGFEEGINDLSQIALSEVHESIAIAPRTVGFFVGAPNAVKTQTPRGTGPTLTRAAATASNVLSSGGADGWVIGLYHSVHVRAVLSAARFCNILIKLANAGHD